MINNALVQEEERSEGGLPPKLSRPNYMLHLGLFVATCITTFLSGSGIAGEFDALKGMYFSGTIMTILLCHEMGHYFVAKYHGIAASLPFFIPLPPVISLGTLGAVIQMDQPIEDRNKLLDVGAAGPLAGLLVAIPLLVYGLGLSPLEHSAAQAGTMVEGNSILYLGLKFLVHGLILPGENGLDVQLHPIAFAAWVGLLITMINLLPIGQLDGGHIACAALGRRHENFSKVLHWMLLAIGGLVTLYCTSLNLDTGAPLRDSLVSAAKAGLPWLVWAGMLLYMKRVSGGEYHPRVGNAALNGKRVVLAALMLFVLILIFTPIPLREVL